MNYILFRDGMFPVDTLAGTGLALNFGSPLIAGSYTILAYSATTACQAPMPGSTVIILSPAAFNVIPAGIICTGSTIGLDGSEAGVNYQLFRDGITAVGTPVAGTGSAISFGVITIPGTYTVKASGASFSCGSTMNGNAVLQPLPLVFTVSPQGMQCAGTSVTLNGSQAGINYVLVLDNTFNIDTIAGNGSVLDFGPQSVTGTYTILAIGGASSCQAAMSGAMQIMAFPAFFNMTPAGITCATATVGLDGSENGVSYTLYKNGSSTGITMAGTGSALVFGIQSQGNYTIKAVNLTSSCSIFMPGTLVISDPPSVNAGSDIVICEDQTALLNASLTFGVNPVWSTSGDGTFTPGNALVSIYTPGASDIAAGTVNLFLTANGTGSCASTLVTDTLTVTIDHSATANGGGNIDVCSAADYTISGATATNYSAITWSSSGSGSFDDDNILHPTYTPSAADLAAGSVNLTLLVNSISPCSNAAISVIVMTFHQMVTASAGADAVICEGNTFTVAFASATNSVSVAWTTTGTGTFTFGNTLTATYSPGAADITAGSVGLILTAVSSAPCTFSTSDTLLLTIIPAPVSQAGADASICENTSLNISDASVAHATSLLWSTSGSGSFSNSSVINPVYIPSAADIAAGSVVLTLSVDGNAPCISVTDQKTVTFILNPIVNAGPDVHMCNTPFTLSGATATSCASVLWTVLNGSGTLANATTLTPAYTPSAGDIANGFVILALAGTPQSPCVNGATDFVTLLIDQVPAVNAGADIATCDNTALTISDATASAYTALSWSTSGTGTFSNALALNPTYTPSAGDLAGGSVTLTLTASNAGCGSFSDTKVISYINHTSVNAGPDVTICEGSSVTISGAVANAYASLSWTSSGSGSFSGGNTVTPTYTPSAADITSGTVTLSLNAVSVAPCTNVISDQTVITIQGTPVVAAGSDAYICSTDVYSNTDASVLNTAVLTWTSSGDGTFSNPNSLVNTYTPGAADLAGGSVTLTLTAGNNAPCADVSDSKVVSFMTGPVANAGPGAVICNTCSFVAVAASSQNSTSVLWSSNGSGSFNNTSLLHTTYTPSASDYAQGSVVLMLTAFSTPPCSLVTDTMTLSFSNAPGVDFSWGPACQGQAVAFSVDAATTNVGAIASWIWSFGDGSSSSLMNPTHLFAGLGLLYRYAYRY